MTGGHGRAARHVTPSGHGRAARHVTPSGHRFGLARLRAALRERPGARRLPAIGVICFYLVLLLCIPSVLIFAPLGAPGTPSNMLGIGALAWWVCATIGGRNPVRGLTPIRVAAASLATAVLLGYANGTANGWFSPRRSARASTTDAAGAHDGPDHRRAGEGRGPRPAGRTAGWLGVLLLAAEGIRSWRDVDILVSWVSWLAAMVAALGIVQFFTGLDIASLFVIPGLTPNSSFGAVASRSVLNRVASTAAHPIEYGVVLAALFPLALHRTLFRWGEKLALVPTALIGVGMFLSVSRSAVLAVAIAFLVLLVGWPGGWRLRALAIAPFAAVGLRVAIPGPGRDAALALPQRGQRPERRGADPGLRGGPPAVGRAPVLRARPVHDGARVLPDPRQRVPPAAGRARRGGPRPVRDRAADRLLLRPRHAPTRAGPPLPPHRAEHLRGTRRPAGLARDVRRTRVPHGRRGDVLPDRSRGGDLAAHPGGTRRSTTSASARSPACCRGAHERGGRPP